MLLLLKKELVGTGLWDWARAGRIEFGSSIKYEKLSRGTILISTADEEKVVQEFVKLKLIVN